MVVFCVILLRSKEPELERFVEIEKANFRPYKTLFFIPICFCIGTVGLLIAGIIYSPFQAALAVSFILVGVFVYWSTVSRLDGLQTGIRHRSTRLIVVYKRYIVGLIPNRPPEPQSVGYEIAEQEEEPPEFSRSES
jgi:hypothetical protein